jgi:hypothetical protein
MIPGGRRKGVTGKVPSRPGSGSQHHLQPLTTRCGHLAALSCTTFFVDSKTWPVRCSTPRAEPPQVHYGR